MKKKKIKTNNCVIIPMKLVEIMDEYKEIERSIITKYRKTIWSRFVKAVQDYELIKENDNIIVQVKKDAIDKFKK